MGSLWLCLFGWLPSPIPQLVLGILAVALIVFVWKLWILIKGGIPFL